MANNDQIKQARLRGILKKDIEGIKSAQAQQAVGTETTQQSSQPTRTDPRAPSIKFDELNIVETLHPANKDYGHIKIDEPDTPFVRNHIDEVGPLGGADPDELMIKLANLKIQNKENAQKVDEDSFVPETAGFLEARKQHYKEYDSVKEARELIEKEFAEENGQQQGTSQKQPQK